MKILYSEWYFIPTKEKPGCLKTKMGAPSQPHDLRNFCKAAPFSFLWTRAFQSIPTLPGVLGCTQYSRWPLKGYPSRKSTFKSSESTESYISGLHFSQLICLQPRNRCKIGVFQRALWMKISTGTGEQTRLMNESTEGTDLPVNTGEKAGGRC